MVEFHAKSQQIILVSMDQNQRQLIKKYLDVILRRKKIIIAFFLLGCAGGLLTYIITPKVYKSTSLIQYERQRINPTVMSPDDVKTRTQEVVSTVSQQVTSRTSLETIINDFDLYPAMRAAMPMEDVVETMRARHIDISPDTGDIFKVSYEGRDPKKVLLVTNALAAKFIEENLRYREERASETSEYVKDELKMAKEGLDKKEEVMRDYKLQYYNEMPEQLPNNMARLNALQEQYQNNQTSMHDVERTRIMVQEQITLRKELLAQQVSGYSMAPLVPGTPQGAAGGGLAEINQLRRELQNLQARYTDKHPEIRRVKKLLQELEEQYNGQINGKGEASADTDTGEASPANDVKAANIDPQIEQLKQQLKDQEYAIARLNNEREEIKKQIEKYQKWVEAAPVREAEWASLTRDYEQLDQHYQALVAQGLQAESARSLEMHQKGSQFKIIDPAHFPEKPYKPDFKKIMLMAVGLGLGIGCGLALGLELVGTSFKEPDELETFLGLPVVCAVPKIYTKRDLSLKKNWQYFWGGLLFVAVALIALAAIYFWKQGMIIL